MKTKVFQLKEKQYSFYSPIHGIVNLSYPHQVADYFKRYHLGEYTIVPHIPLPKEQ